MKRVFNALLVPPYMICLGLVLGYVMISDYLDTHRR